MTREDMEGERESEKKKTKEQHAAATYICVHACRLIAGPTNRDGTLLSRRSGRSSVYTRTRRAYVRKIKVVYIC